MKIGDREIEIYPAHIMLFLLGLLILGVAIFTINDALTKSEKQNQEKITYMEKLGAGVVLGKTHNEREYEVAIQFKDTIFYVGNKEYYYLLKEGDSIEVKKGKILIK